MLTTIIIYYRHKWMNEWIHKQYNGDNVEIIYSPSCCSRPIWLPFLWETQKKIFFVEFSPIPPHNDSLLWLIKTLVIAMISLVFVVPNQHFGGALDEGKTAETEQECVGLSV